MRQSSVRNACEPASEGGMRSDMAYRPAMGFLAHSMVHSVFILARSCRWSFSILVVSVAGLSSVASFANSSALSFPSISMCPGTHETSMLANFILERTGRVPLDVEIDTSAHVFKVVDEKEMRFAGMERRMSVSNRWRNLVVTSFPSKVDIDAHWTRTKPSFTFAGPINAL